MCGNATIRLGYGTFRVDMSQTTLCPGGPHIAGSFNGWNASATPMTAIGNGIYEVVLMLDTTQSYQYKFLKDSTWACGDETVPAACAVNNNREVVVPEHDTILPTVCFGSCAPCQIVPNPTVDVTFRVDVSQNPCTGGGPHLVGSFNGWNATATPMTAVGAGVYEATVSLDTTASVQYKFLNDSTYSACGNENVPAACGVPNGFGGFNRQLEVPEINSTLSTVCFSSCAACIPPGMVNVTFRVDMAFTTLGPGGPHVAGTFNSFNAAATPMTNVGGSVYAATIMLDTTATVEYTFLKDSTYIDQEVITALCGVPNGFGGFNRQLFVPEADSTLIAYCYSSCFTCNVGINDVSKSQLIMYPNPAGNFITIELPLQTQAGLLLITNATGQVVVKQKVTGLKQQIDISTLPIGVYAVQSITDNKLAVSKLIKQ
ncbi:MAG TPA: T9SS type A sorting domain-containing protein [Bacteroidia bacterium]|nr:T9SS type A sorting domain-containing protein [Bacteroidia bacterium]